ncbi:hypothetical protein [Actinopolyspora erythraea]|uniref:hypothetical protein n=1 Tax=Actinopolyspora erythraea TaxID=414996 RepID=UPI0012B52BB5|nr:hypothetical protein [Actinopolyspora erythraea]
MLIHALEKGVTTPTLRNESGHLSIRVLSRYARLSADVLGGWHAERAAAVQEVDAR